MEGGGELSSKSSKASTLKGDDRDGKKWNAFRLLLSIAGGRSISEIGWGAGQSFISGDPYDPSLRACVPCRCSLLRLSVAIEDDNNGGEEGTTACWLTSRAITSLNSKKGQL